MSCDGDEERGTMRMARHEKNEKRVRPRYFEKILSGEKTFELRLADWACAEGATLLLREWNPATNA